MIQIENINKTFPITKKLQRELEIDQKFLNALTNVSFVCKPGRIFSLLGPNGAGKTTLLRLIASILKPTSGTISVNGFDTIKNDMKVRQQIGFLTGSAGLYERLTANELIKYFSDLYHVDKSSFEKRKKELYDLLSIDFGNKRIGQLSTGMKQKISIVRTMIHNPEVVIFDEPTAGLDIIAAKNIIELIKQCKNENKTVLFSSHIMSEVELLSDDLAILYKGTLCYNGSMDNFRNQMRTKNMTEEFIYFIETHKN